MGTRQAQITVWTASTEFLFLGGNGTSMDEINEDYEINQRCQICCFETGPRAHERYCNRCAGSTDLVPIPISELYENGNSLIKLNSDPSWLGRPNVGFG